MDERTSMKALEGYKITAVISEGYQIQIFGRKGRGKEKLIAMSSMATPCIFDGDGNLFAEIAG